MHSYVSCPRCSLLKLRAIDWLICRDQDGFFPLPVHALFWAVATLLAKAETSISARIRTTLLISPYTYQIFPHIKAYCLLQFNPNEFPVLSLMAIQNLSFLVTKGTAR